MSFATSSISIIQAHSEHVTLIKVGTQVFEMIECSDKHLVSLFKFHMKLSHHLFGFYTTFADTTIFGHIGT